MNLELRFPAPQSFVYMSKRPQTIIDGIRMEEQGDVVGLYSIKVFDVPLLNEKRWGLYLETEYLEDEEMVGVEMDFNEVFTTSIKEVIEYTKKQFLSPSMFVDIKLFNVDGGTIPVNIDWDTLKVRTADDNKYQKIVIGVYIDNIYLNESLVTMNNSANTRMNKSETQ